MVTCSVANCKNNLARVDYSKQSSKRLGYFSFPKDKRIRQLWIRACQRKDEFNLDNARVCSDHFKKEDFARNLEAELLNIAHRRRSLRKEAVPSLKLPPEALRGLDEVGSKRAARQAIRERKAIVRELLSDTPSSHQRQSLSSFVEFCKANRKPKPPSQVVLDHTKKEKLSNSPLLNINESTDERKVYVRVGSGMTYMLCNVSEIPPSPQLVEVKMESTDAFYDENLTVPGERSTSPSLLKIEVDPADVYCDATWPEGPAVTAQQEPDLHTENFPSTSAWPEGFQISVKQEPELVAEDLQSTRLYTEERKINIKEEPGLVVEDRPSTSTYGTEPAQLACYYCDYASDSLGKLRMHLVRLHLGSIGSQLTVSSRLQCTNTSKVSTLKGKMSETTSENIHIVKQNGETDVTSLKQRGQRTYLCTLCSFHCKQSTHLKVHMMKHLGEKPFHCSLCSYKTRISSHLKRHMLTHSGENPFQCHLCSYSCKQGTLLKTHMNQNKHEGKRPFSCTLCTNSFCRESALKIHMLVHGEEKPYRCTNCGYTCKQLGNLKTHMLIHDEKKPYHCTLCSYISRHSSSLKTHMLLHEKEKPYHCTVCTYTCRLSGYLKRHMLVHGERKHNCTFCSYTCKNKSYLKSHMLKHTGQFPFHCNLCTFSCGQSAHLRIHMMKHMGEYSFHCSFCSYKGRISSHLKQHMLTVHKGISTL